MPESGRALSLIRDILWILADAQRHRVLREASRRRAEWL